MTLLKITELVPCQVSPGPGVGDSQLQPAGASVLRVLCCGLAYKVCHTHSAILRSGLFIRLAL